MRRAQEKADKKQELAKERLKAERILKRERRRQRIQNRTKPKAKQTSSVRDSNKRPPGRWSGIFAMFVAVFIVLQAVLPVDTSQNQLFSMIVNVLYYFMFGYFLQLWMSRSKISNGFYLTIATGVALTLGLISAQFFIPLVTPDIQLAFFAIPAIILGTFMGQLVYNRA